MPSAIVKASSWAAVAPASRMWYPLMLTVFHRGTSREQNSIMSVTIRMAGRGGTSHACCAMNSFRQSFWMVPPILSRPMPRLSARAT
jgi:hypothetical protein